LLSAPFSSELATEEEVHDTSSVVPAAVAFIGGVILFTADGRGLEAWELFKRGPAEFSALLLRFFATGVLIVTEDEL